MSEVQGLGDWAGSWKKINFRAPLEMAEQRVAAAGTVAAASMAEKLEA